MSECALLLRMETTGNTPKCWCGAPAEFVNPATDATEVTAVCLDHIADGYRPIDEDYNPGYLSGFYVWPSDSDGYEVRDRDNDGRTIATCPTADDAAHVAFALNHTHYNR